MNAMGHDLANLIGVDHRGLAGKIKKIIPGYMAMGERGMADMTEMEMPLPVNTIPMMTGDGPYGSLEMGGMFTIFKVRDNLTSYADPGWYEHPPGTVAESIDNEKNMKQMKHQDHNMNKMNPLGMKQNMGSMDHDMQNMKGMQMQNSHHNMNTVSWFSQEEDQKERHIHENNWMQSKPEDSMGGHMHHKMENMSEPKNQMQHKGH